MSRCLHPGCNLEARPAIRKGGRSPEYCLEHSSKHWANQRTRMRRAGHPMTTIRPEERVIDDLRNQITALFAKWRSRLQVES